MTQDLHAHVVPPGLLDLVDATTFGFDLHLGAATAPPGADRGAIVVPEALVDVDGRLRAMDDAGVDVQVLSPWIELLSEAADATHATDFARAFNSTLADLVAAHPARFDGLGTVPLSDPEVGAAELHHAVDVLGLAGVEIHSRPADRELDDTALEPFWAAAEALRALVLIHPYAPRGRDRLTRYRLTDIVGNPSETTAAIGHLVLGGVLDRHPTLRICLVHGGGTLPALAGRFDAIAGGSGTRPPSEWMRTFFYDSLTHSPRALRSLIDFAGSEQVVLGSDYPFDVGDPTPVASVDAVPGLSEAERRAILAVNLERLRRSVKRPGGDATTR